MAEMSNSISKIPQHIFHSYIVEKLRVVNPFVAYAHDEGRYVQDGAVVHIPQSGKSPDVVKNRKEFPATAKQREDSELIYPLDVYSTDPVVLTWHEAHEISYNKMDSILGDHVSTLSESVGDNLLYNWVAAKNAADYSAVTLPAGHIISTSGKSVSVTERGQTGSRKSLVAADIQAAQAMMNKQGVPLQGRYVLLESYMYTQLIDSLSSNQMAAFQQTADIKNGVLGQLYGFNILQRSRVLSFTADGTPKLPGEAYEATDHVGALVWQRDCVAKALGETKIFQHTDNPLYYGDTVSALVKMGGRARRADWAGVIAIVQGAV